MALSKSFRKWLALALAFILVFSMLPAAAFATEEPAHPEGIGNPTAGQNESDVALPYKTEESSHPEETDNLTAEQDDTDTTPLSTTEQSVLSDEMDTLATEQDDAEVTPLASAVAVPVDVTAIFDKSGTAFSEVIIVRQVPNISNELALYYEDSSGGSLVYERLCDATSSPIESVQLNASGIHFEFYGVTTNIDGIVVDGTDYSSGGSATLSQEIKLGFGTPTTPLSITSSSPVHPAFKLMNGAQVSATINNATTFASSDGLAGMNVPNEGTAGVKPCGLTIYGVNAGSTNPPVLTANGGAGAAGIGGNSGDTGSSGQHAGTVTIKSSVTINANGGRPVANMYAGGAGIGGGSALSDSTSSVNRVGGDGGKVEISPLSPGQTIVINAIGQQDAAGIGGGAGSPLTNGTGGNGPTYIDNSVVRGEASNVSVTATSTGRGAGIGGGGGNIGGSSGTVAIQGDHLLAESKSGAGIGGGAGEQRGGDCSTLDFYNGTIRAISRGFSSAIGGGSSSILVDGTRGRPNNMDGRGGTITFHGNMTDKNGMVLPLYITAEGTYGNDLGSGTNAPQDTSSIIVQGGSIVAFKVAKPPVNSAGTNVYPVVVPKITDDGNNTDLTAQYRLAVASHNYYASTTGTAHNNYSYAAMLWLPEGYSGNIVFKKSDSDMVVATGGFVYTLAKLSPNFIYGENVVSFKPQYFNLTLQYGKDLAPASPIQVQAGTVYKLPVSDKVISAYKIVGWEDSSGTSYDFGADYSMPYADTTLKAVWGEQTLEEVLDKSGTDDLSQIAGNKDAKVKFTTDRDYLGDVSCTTTTGTAVPLVEGVDYVAVKGSTIITLKASWLSTLKPGTYILKVTYFDPSTIDTSPDAVYSIPFTKVGGPTLPKTGDTPWLYGAGAAALLSLILLGAAYALRRRVKVAD